MRTTRNRSLLALPLSIVCVFLLAGCSIHTSKSSDNKDKDVDIRSPFGSISVHQGGVDAKDIGLPVYPGARPRTGHDDDGDSDNANVNISSSLFGVKVVVQKFESDDSPDKVLDFYQKPMGKYGKVIQCSGGYHRSFHHHDKDEPVSCDDSGGSEKQLKVGTENDQHVVAVKPQGKGSEFTLVYVRARESNDKDTI
jgi:hypothetical protein